MTLVLIGKKVKAAELLKQGSGVGDHLVLLLEIYTHSVLGHSNPKVISAPGRILRADVHAYKSKYNKVLEFLFDRRRMFEQLTEIIGSTDAALNKYEVRMNKWNDKIKDFMLSAEKKYRTFKYENIMCSPGIKMWLGRRWAIGRLQKFIAKGKASLQ